MKLSKFNIETEAAVTAAAAVPKDRNQFSRSFTPIVGFMLHGFFQHNDSHPDYCGCYYKFSEQHKRFFPIAYVSGGEKNAVSDDPKLGLKSFAYRAYSRGHIVTWHRSEKPDGRPKPDPAVSKKLQRFICIPVPPGENVPAGARLGVLCIDSSKEGIQFNDEYHRNILVWVSSKLAQLDRLLLVNQQEWLNGNRSTWTW